MNDGGQQPLRELSADERLDWLRLARCPRIGPVTFRHLIAQYGSAAAALEALPELAARAGTRRIEPPTRAAAARELEHLNRLGGCFLACGEPGYPAELAALEDAPPLLALRGVPNLLERPAVAVVGARNASANGRRLAENLARELSEEGFLVVSGLARGIDAAAHAGALAGGTAAVLAGGVDVVYPPQNEALYRRLSSDGLLLSEMPLGLEPQARHFPRRNRLISGLARGVVVVEAALRSGSLITARLAGEQGRDVFAVPGSPLDPRARGCNHLIRQGAQLIESASDVVEALRVGLGPARQVRPIPQVAPQQIDIPEDQTPPSEPGAVQSKIVELLGSEPVGVDELIRRCQVSAAAVSLALLELELAGRLERHPGNQVALVYQSAEGSC